MANTFSDISNWLSGGSLSKGLSDEQQAADVVGNTAIPDLSTLIPQLQKQVDAGQITPAQMQAAVQKASAYSKIAVDPQYLNDANQSLNQEKAVAQQGGLTAIDKAQLLNTQNQIAGQNAAEQQAIQNNLAQKGQANSGSMLAQKLSAAQGNANANSLAGANVAANAQQRSLQAMQNYGQQASGLQSQLYNQGAQAANAENAINQFNAQNQQSAAANNANLAQQANLTGYNAQQAVNANNTGIANTQAMLPYNTAQQNFTNTLNRNTATSNALNKAGTALTAQGNTQASNTANTVGQVGSAVAKYGPGIWDAVSSWFSDEDLKEDIKPVGDDIESMMEQLTGKKFKYKSGSVPDDGGKEHMGVMAQDAEKAGLNTMDTPDGKKIMDDGHLKGVMLAALGNLHQRLNNLENK